MGNESTLFIVAVSHMEHYEFRARHCWRVHFYGKDAAETKNKNRAASCAAGAPLHSHSPSTTPHPPKSTKGRGAPHTKPALFRSRVFFWCGVPCVFLGCWLLALDF